MRLSYLLFLSGLILTACASDQGVLVCHVSGGEIVKIAITAKGPEHANNKDVHIDAAACYVEEGKKELKFGFVFSELKHETPQHVKVEDVSDHDAEVLVDDASPKLNDKGAWHGTSAPKTGDDKTLGWLFHIDNTFRIYRFTIVTADGRTLTMYEASIVPGFVKMGMRKALDMK